MVKREGLQDIMVRSVTNFCGFPSRTSWKLLIRQLKLLRWNCRIPTISITENTSKEFCEIIPESPWSWSQLCFKPSCQLFGKLWSPLKQSRRPLEIEGVLNIPQPKDHLIVRYVHHSWKYLKYLHGIAMHDVYMYIYLYIIYCYGCYGIAA